LRCTSGDFRVFSPSLIGSTSKPDSV